MPLPNPLQAVVTARTTPLANQESIQIALFDATGAALNVPKKAAAQADSVASTVAALVTDFNALLAKLRAAGIMS